ncbi:hypothetical protein RJC24_11325 [Staphylococcus epidermidis]|uniref:hypothetical protein n=1 Tax=Staphylococcus epidermidis TaxID=1282 RepID=UPI00287AB9BB|nr:hypothetical protein [Staphylococcus epidermidis]MDS3929983.1 hypothetical protein [Staphylococcus epidermidis]
MKKIIYPFTRNCVSYKDGDQDFYYDTMINSDRIYYKLKNQIDNYISTAVVKKIDNDNDQYQSKFDEIDHVEKYSIEKLGVVDNYSNMGVMTVMFCDIILAIINREFSSKYNIVIHLCDISHTTEIEKVVNVYQSVLPNYKKMKTNSDNKRIEVKGNRKNEIFYLFLKQTRKDDIEYYKELRQNKIIKINNVLNI